MGCDCYPEKDELKETGVIFHQDYPYTVCIMESRVYPGKTVVGVAKYNPEDRENDCFRWNARLGLKTAFLRALDNDMKLALGQATGQNRSTEVSLRSRNLKGLLKYAEGWGIRLVSASFKAYDRLTFWPIPMRRFVPVTLENLFENQDIAERTVEQVMEDMEEAGKAFFVFREKGSK